MNEPKVKPLPSVVKFKRKPYKRRRFFSAGKVLALLFVISVAQYYVKGSVTWVTDAFRWVENSTRQLISAPTRTLESAGETITATVSDLTNKVRHGRTATISRSEPTAGITLSSVVKVVDGDTIHVTDNKGIYIIRLYGIDAPEAGQAYSRTSKSNLEKLIAEAKVRVIKIDTDRHGRTVAKIYHGDTYINDRMVREGYAWWYEPYAQYEFKLRSAQREAQQAKRGLWQDPNPMPPWEYRGR